MLRPPVARPADYSARCAHQSQDQQTTLLLRPPVARPADNSAHCAHQSRDQQTTPLAASTNPMTRRRDSSRCSHQSRSLRPPVPWTADDSVCYAHQSHDQTDKTPSLRPPVARLADEPPPATPPQSCDEQTRLLATPTSRKTSRRLRSLRPPVSRPADDSTRCTRQSPDQQRHMPVLLIATARPRTAGAHHCPSQSHYR